MGVLFLPLAEKGKKMKNEGVYCVDDKVFVVFTSQFVIKEDWEEYKFMVFNRIEQKLKSYKGKKRVPREVERIIDVDTDKMPYIFSLPKEIWEICDKYKMLE